MRALITGIEGFVGPYLAAAFEAEGIETIGTFLSGGVLRRNQLHMDVTDEAEVVDVIKSIRPDYVVHLAGFSSVAASFQNAEACKNINVGGTSNILDAITNEKIKPRILVVSSAEVYGKPRFIPITEKHPLIPQSPYAESRIEQERLCRKFIKEHKLDIVISRSFNHSGSGQSDAFVLSNFSKQIAMIEKGSQISIKVGNLDAIRDFSDVRDVVKAYIMLLKRGKRGDVLNVCSGKGYAIKEMLGMLIGFSNIQISVEVDPARLRRSDIPVLVGDNKLCVSRTGWRPTIPIEATLKDLLEYWRSMVNRREK